MLACTYPIIHTDLTHMPVDAPEGTAARKVPSAVVTSASTAPHPRSIKHDIKFKKCKYLIKCISSHYLSYTMTFYYNIIAASVKGNAKVTLP